MHKLHTEPCLVWRKFGFACREMNSFSGLLFLWRPGKGASTKIWGARKLYREKVKNAHEAHKNLPFLWWNCQIWANLNTFEIILGTNWGKYFLGKMSPCPPVVLPLCGISVFKITQSAAYNVVHVAATLFSAHTPATINHLVFATNNLWLSSLI